MRIAECSWVELFSYEALDGAERHSPWVCALALLLMCAGIGGSRPYVWVESSEGEPFEGRQTETLSVNLCPCFIVVSQSYPGKPPPGKECVFLLSVGVLSIMEYHRLGGWKIYFLTVLEVEVQDQGARRVWWGLVFRLPFLPCPYEAFLLCVTLFNLNDLLLFFS